jgi:FAD/FMN-containing dehydrogenase
MMRETFGADYERLRAVKRRFDPDNTFQSNINIPP